MKRSEFADLEVMGDIFRSQVQRRDIVVRLIIGYPPLSLFVYDPENEIYFSITSEISN